MNRARLLLAVTGSLVVLAGCSQNNTRAQRKEILGDPTPELWTNRERPVDAENELHMTVSTNMRSLQSDIGRALLLNRPSRLTPEPIR